ncbi:MAG: hypothetical protein CBARDCOR_4195 [uncultured Caballeronia sp.]|nr:MAG: hypothetical protein CBARDCOR_4195 [uncultured Caballeronia sp.]
MQNLNGIKIWGHSVSLGGNIEFHGSKNCAMPFLTAAALQYLPATIKNTPNLSDIHNLLRLFQHCAVNVKIENNRIDFLHGRLPPKIIDFPPNLSGRLRGSIYALALPASAGHRALLQTIGGHMSFQPHCKALRALRLKISAGLNSIEITGGKPRSAEFYIDDQGITATSLAVLVAFTIGGNRYTLC